MTNAQQILAELDRADIIIERRGDRLKIDAPVGALNADLLDRIRRHKSDILGLVELHDPDPAQVQYTMKEVALMRQTPKEVRATVDSVKKVFAAAGGATVVSVKRLAVRDQDQFSG